MPLADCVNTLFSGVYAKDGLFPKPLRNCFSRRRPLILGRPKIRGSSLGDFRFRSRMIKSPPTRFSQSNSSGVSETTLIHLAYALRTGEKGKKFLGGAEVCPSRSNRRCQVPFLANPNDRFENKQKEPGTFWREGRTLSDRPRKLFSLPFLCIYAARHAKCRTPAGGTLSQVSDTWRGDPRKIVGNFFGDQPIQCLRWTLLFLQD